jgi:hypothetical protein
MSNRIFSAILMFLLVLGTLVMPIVMLSVKATDLSGSPPSFWVEPETENFNNATTPVGTLFNVTVWGATPVNDSAGFQTITWQVNLGFNASQLQAVKVGATDGATSELFAGHTTVFPTPVITNTGNGSVLAGETLLGNDSIGAKSASLFWVEFNVTAAPSLGQTLTSNIDPAYGLINFIPVETWYYDTATNYESGLTTAFCTYSYASWSAPVSVGSNVTVSLPNNLNLTFANVTIAGIATLNETPTVQAPVLNITVGLYYDIKVTASYAGNVTVILAFDGSNMTQQQKSNLTMMEYAPIPGDIVAPFGQLDIKDLSYIARHFATTPKSPNWDSSCDITGSQYLVPDGKVDIKDISLAAKSFGKTSHWVNITTYVDTTNNIIYGNTTHFSLIGIH